MGYIKLNRYQEDGIVSFDVTDKKIDVTNRSKTIININCVQPFARSYNDGYAYSELISEAHSFLKKHLEDQYTIIDDPCFSQNYTEYKDGIKEIDFECTIIKNITL